MKVLLIDWSVIAYEAWHSMGRKDYISETGSEIVEFTRQIAKAALYLTERFAPDEDDEIYFILDSKNWRVPFYRSYYKKFLKTWRVKHSDGRLGYLFSHDTYNYLIWDDMVDPQLKDIKLTKKAVNEIRHQVRRKPIENPYSIARIRPYLPAYKGNRKKQKWNYDTSKEDFKERYRNKSAYSLARTLGAKIVEVDNCEADDIIYAASLHHSAHDVVCVSSDSDLDQIRARCLFFRRWTPETDKRSFIEKSGEEALNDLMEKILTGDKSDNIKPVNKDKSTCITPKPAKKILESVKNWDEFISGDWTKHPSFKRNLRLVDMDAAPEKVKTAAREAVEAAKVPKEEKRIKLEKYGLSKATILGEKAKAKQHREESP